MTTHHLTPRSAVLTIILTIVAWAAFANFVAAQVIIRSEANTARIDCGVDLDLKVKQVSSLSLRVTASTPKSAAITIKTHAGVVLGTCAKTTVCGATWPIKTLRVGENAITAEAIDAVTGCGSGVTVFVDK